MARSRWLPNDNVDPLIDLLVAVIKLARRDETASKNPVIRDDAQQFLDWARAEFEPNLQIPLRRVHASATPRWEILETAEAQRMAQQRMNVRGQGSATDNAQGQSSRARRLAQGT